MRVSETLIGFVPSVPVNTRFQTGNSARGFFGSWAKDCPGAKRSEPAMTNTKTLRISLLLIDPVEVYMEYGNSKIAICMDLDFL